MKPKILIKGNYFNMKDIEMKKLYELARCETYASTHNINKNVFHDLISSMITKLVVKKDKASLKQLSILEQMNKFLDRLTLKNVIYVFQAKLICKMEVQITILEQEKRDLIQRSIDKIKELESEKSELNKELTNVKKRIKNDKESS